MYWQRKLETMARPELEALQAKRLKSTVSRTGESGFCAARYRDCGVDASSISDVSDVASLPFTRKTDLRDNYPKGLMIDYAYAFLTRKGKAIIAMKIDKPDEGSDALAGRYRLLSPGDVSAL